MFQATNQILNPVLVSSLFSQALQHSSSLGGDADCSRPGVETILTASLFFFKKFHFTFQYGYFMLFRVTWC
jgi:hypothetical protein